MTRTSLIVGLSDTLKDELGVWAQAHDMSVAAAVRQAIAAHIGYDLEAESAAGTSLERRGRPRQYASKEARRAASRARSKARRKLAKELIQEHALLEARESMQKFAESVASRRL